MLWWPTAATWAGARGLAEGVLSRYWRLIIKILKAYNQDISDHACHARIGATSPAAAARRTGAHSGGRWWTGADTGMTCMVRRVLMIRVMIRVQDTRLHLLGLPLLATKAFSAKILRHRHYATNLEESQSKNEKPKCLVNSNLASTPRNSLFRTSSGSLSTRSWDPEISAGPYQISSAVIFYDDFKVLQFYRRTTLLARHGAIVRGLHSTSSLLYRALLQNRPIFS